jgi:hypothetical protein
MSTSNHIQMTLIDSNQSSPEVTANTALVKTEESTHKMLDVAMGDANQTLTDGQYNGYGIYRCTGALTAQKDLIVPTRQKRSVVINDTSGGYGVQVKTASGTGVVVPAGESTSVYSDGTNVRAFSGGGVGGAVTSVFSRTGAVVAAAGDYGPTTGGTGQTSWAKGDILGGTGTNTLGKLTVGTNDYVLTADSSQTTGFKWAATAPGVTLKTDGVSNGTQTILDLISGTNITITDNGDGTVTIDSAGGGGNFAENEVPTGTINGSNTDFTLANTPTAGSVKLYTNGLRQRPTTDFTVSGTTITYTTAPTTGWTHIVDYRY